MDLDVSFLITEYLHNQLNVFTADDFYKYLRKKNVRFTKEQAIQVLCSSEFVFALVNNEFVTRAGAFTDKFFSFKPSLEEVKKGHFLLGHRCMPFVNPDISPDCISVCVGDKFIPSVPTKFSMNLALDVFSFFGEGYSLSYIFNDRSNKEHTIAALAQFDLPTSMNLTSWPLDIFGPEVKFEYGDRILCRVEDWSTNQISVKIQKQNENPLSVSFADIEREEWYSKFESAMLESFEKNGPGGSIEEQLAFLFLENNEILCNENCGSCEEILSHSEKIQFQPFGVESRLWRKGENVPFCGRWNTSFTNESMLSEIAMMFSPSVLDAYLSRTIVKEVTENLVLKEEDFENIEYEIFPSTLDLGPAERKSLLLNIKKRHDILLKQYNKENDSKIAYLRDKVLILFSDVGSLLCEIGCNCETYDEFPQQDLVILTQLFSHLVSLIEEMQNPFIREQFPVDDTLVSLDGMTETFSDISYPLKRTLKKIIYNKVDIKKSDS